MTDQNETCNCPEFMANVRRCMHTHPATTIHRVDYPPSNLVDPPPAKEPKKKKPNYPRNWAVYNEAQTTQKSHFMDLLAGLCEFVEEVEATGPGRPRIPLSDLAFLMIYKVFEQTSTRRFMSDAGIAHRSGCVASELHFNSIINGMNSERMTSELLKLIEVSSLPFRGLEQTFAADSSGFSASQYDRWQEIKPESNADDDSDRPKAKKKKKKRKEADAENDREMMEKERQIWAKVHLMCGVKTHVVTAVVIKDKDASDTPQLPELIEKTAMNFTMGQVCADKAYGSINNYQVMADHGIDPFIPFKSNQTGAGKGRSGKEHMTEGGALWKRKFHQFHFYEDEFNAIYHLRSNVETVFSMIKRNFGSAVRSKTERAMMNEVLCKIICHNIWCITKATFELGLNADDLRPTRPRVPNFQVVEGGLGRHAEMRPA